MRNNTEILRVQGVLKQNGLQPSTTQLDTSSLTSYSGEKEVKMSSPDLNSGLVQISKIRKSGLVQI